VTGHGESHRRLEAALAEFKGAEAALVFSSGFAANAGTIAALVDRGDTVFGDELNHASLIDGCRLSRAEVQVYPHRDVAALEELLRSSSAARRRLIVTDSVFSMDGDLAPLTELAELADRYDAMLMVDEAHATGIFGAHGRGLAEALGVESRVDVSVGTLSKALGSVGGFISGRKALIEWLVNRARTYVFSTALPAAACAAALAGLEIVRQEPGRREQLLKRVEYLRRQLSDQGWLVGASASQIIPVVVGSEARALSLGAQLQAAGLLVPAIRPPSVPPGKSLLRISVSSAHTVPMIDSLLAALASQASARVDSGSRDDSHAPSPFGRGPG
jgi:8-amino-7-oxononanoate synthase